MSEPIHEFDVVALTENLPSVKVLRGSVGTVVMVYSPEAFEVEFLDNDGRTYGLATVGADKLLRLTFEPIAAA